MIEMLKSVARNTLPARIYGPIRARRVRRYISGFAPRTVEHLYAGHHLKVRLEDPLAQAWYDRDWPEPSEIRELRRGRLRRGARVIDIGAHQGIVALILARIVGDDGLVVAVEAEPHNAAVARSNAEANDAANMTVLHAAAGAANGVLSFTEGLNGNVAQHGAPGAVEVASLTVDELARRYGSPDVVLIDVEGYEAHVLDGAHATIASGATDFFVELHSAPMLAAAGSTADEVVDCFPDDQFEVLIAVVGDTAPGVDGALESTWEDASSLVHQLGRRCFLVARPTASADRLAPDPGHSDSS